jgi:phage pi2 protein 07
MTITVASVPHREYPVAEVWYGDCMWAEVHQENGVLGVDFYPNPDGGPWRFEHKQVMAALTEAQAKLTITEPAAAMTDYR